jgi:hypothetical protein
MFWKAGRRPLVVVDFGTATTFDAVSAKGNISEAPSVRRPDLADALFQRAASSRAST